MVRYLWMGAIALSVMAFREANSYQPPAAQTGAPFDNGSCGSCHSGGSPAPTITLLANGLPVNGSFAYTPGGGPINMEVRVAHGSAVEGGFELTVATLPTANPANDAAPANNLTAGTGSTILTGTGGRQYLAHQGAQSFSSGAVSWTFTWTPPTADIGTLRWYIAANAANGNGTTGGDATATATFDMPVTPSTTLPTPNSTAQLYWYDPTTHTLILREADRAELFNLGGKRILSLHGQGPHSLEPLSGVYLLRIYERGSLTPVTVRLWLP